MTPTLCGMPRKAPQPQGTSDRCTDHPRLRMRIDLNPDENKPDGLRFRYLVGPKQRNVILNKVKDLLLSLPFTRTSGKQILHFVQDDNASSNRCAG